MLAAGVRRPVAVGEDATATGRGFAVYSRSSLYASGQPGVERELHGVRVELKYRPGDQ